MNDPDATPPPQPAERHEQHVDFSEQFEKRYDLVDDTIPEPVNLAPASEDVPAVNPFAPRDED